MVSRTPADTYTLRNRRLNYNEVPRLKAPTPFSHAAVKAAPAPRPENPPAPFGDLSRASIVELGELAQNIWTHRAKSDGYKCRAGVRKLFGHLETLPGETWQERWEASGFNREEVPGVSILGRPGSYDDSSELASALRMAFATRIVQPPRSPGSGRTSSADIPSRSGCFKRTPAWTPSSRRSTLRIT
ncbi:hypothetical protein ACFTUC_20120 [Streptomyces sp. NPDC056944]|uniref:hypothetical protein n=1 Tax=unclassified Streptomyces TaxID=2593676 RepID=UPI00364508F3